MAQAAKPTVTTEAASAVSQFSAELHGVVNPNGSQVTACFFEYGTTTSYGKSVACTPAPGSGTGGVAVHASAGGLASNTTYHYRVVATNASGTSQGNDVTFTTLAQVPIVATTGVSAVTHTGATLEGTVDPDGEEITACRFEYGTTTSYGLSAACSSAPGSGFGAVAVSGPAAGLSANTIYHFRISATNASGTSTGFDQTFSTATPHGAKVKEGAASTKTFISWGNVRLEGSEGGIGLCGPASGCIVCHTASAGTLFNPAGAAAGERSVQAFATFACEQELFCPSKTTAVATTAGNLPWHDLLTEEAAGTIRQETVGFKVNFLRFEGSSLIVEFKFLTGLKKGSLTEAEKGLRPKYVEGTEALHPGVFEYDFESGEMELEGSSGKVRGFFTGAVKLLGYNAQELIAVKNP